MFGLHEVLSASEQEEERFPFSWYSHPLYVGSFLCHLGYSLGQASQAGLLLSLLLVFMYYIDVSLQKAAQITAAEEEAEASQRVQEVEKEHKKDK